MTEDRDKAETPDETAEADMLEALETPLTIGDLIHALEAARAVIAAGPEAALSAALRSLLEAVGMDEDGDEEEPTP